MQARPGERIVAVNGQPVSRERPPQALLVHQAGAKVELTLAGGRRQRARRAGHAARRRGAGALPRVGRAQPRAGCTSARGGRVGYLHLPDMMSAGFAEFHRYFARRVRPRRADRRRALQPRRPCLAAAAGEGGAQAHRLRPAALGPADAATRTSRAAGPVVALTNEHAGSDGDIFSHGFKLMGIGPLVGKRTWGGVIGIWPRHTLVDGTETTQPEFSFWFSDVGWRRRELRHRPADRGRQRAAGRRSPAATASSRRRSRWRWSAVARAAWRGRDFGPRPRLARAAAAAARMSARRAQRFPGGAVNSFAARPLSSSSSLAVIE
ncbi:MAG: S41 family peptidase [Comamonadaceae bacterium]|nr:S41 family peptidase [Comamonadaceae bacterium]